MAGSGTERPSQIRCVNIDWLEVHVLEDAGRYPLDAYFFQREGWFVKQREYGTRVYEQMFTLLDDHEEPLLEVRRAPKSSTELQGVLSPYSCHIRLANRTCYFTNAVSLLRDFLSRYNYSFKRIFRIDICLDFERFDLGDDPANFIRRYVSHKFAKINQCNRTTRGQDRWDGCEDNYISWGNPKSMVSTKLYNKTKELAEAHDKPYIKQAWMACNLITNPLTMVKVRSDGSQYTPTIWRVEFSVKSGAAGWAILEDCTGAKTKKKPIANTLDCYDNKEKQLQMFASLAHHYFHFKYYEPGQRKDRCKDKVLFHFDFARDQVYKLTRIAQSAPASTDDKRLQRALERYEQVHVDPNIRRACAIILEAISKDQARCLCEDKWDYKQVDELQQILRRRMAMPEEDFQVCVDAVRRLIEQTSDPAPY